MKFLLFLFLVINLSFAQDADIPWESGLSPEIGEEKTIWKKINDYGPIAVASFMGNLDNGGLSLRAMFQPNLPHWKKIKARIAEDLLFETCSSTACGGYERDLMLVANGRLGKADKVELLENEESFNLRKDLILKAQKSIYVLVWAIYNDETGDEFGKLLLTALKKNPNLDIKVVVNGNVATIPGHFETINKIEKLSHGKIQILRWKSWKYRANNNHRKVVLIDNEHVIIGGLNIGNNYSHRVVKKPEDAWRDYDVYLQGASIGIQSYNLFAKVWNIQMDEKPLYNSELNKMELIDYNGGYEGTSVVLVDQDPGTTHHAGTHHIHSAVVKLFRNAKKSIDIETAYLILDPVIREELFSALSRGIKIRIFTNSNESVDQPIISLPIMLSAQEAAYWGADVYLKKGSTLHSKFMVVDEHITMIGSFNFHPRSLRLDGESVAIIFDETLAGKLTKTFSDGVKDADYISDPSKIQFNSSWLSFLTKNFYFDGL